MSAKLRGDWHSDRETFMCLTSPGFAEAYTGAFSGYFSRLSDERLFQMGEPDRHGAMKQIACELLSRCSTSEPSVSQSKEALSAATMMTIAINNFMIERHEPKDGALTEEEMKLDVHEYDWWKEAVHHLRNIPESFLDGLGEQERADLFERAMAVEAAIISCVQSNAPYPSPQQIMGIPLLQEMFPAKYAAAKQGSGNDSKLPA